jgi:hypothetical protein
MGKSPYVQVHSIWIYINPLSKWEVHTQLQILFLGVLEKLREGNLSFVMPVYLSVCLSECPHGITRFS